MRPLALLVVAEFLVLVPLFATWLLAEPAGQADPRRDPVPRDAGPGAARLHASDTPSERGPATDAAVRTAVAAPRSVSSSILVHGRLVAADGGEGPSEASVSFRAGTWRSASAHRGCFAVPGLETGTWCVRAQADGFATYEADHAVGTAPVQTLDLSLQRAQRVQVFLRTPEGGSLMEALTKVGLWRGLHVVASEQPLDADLPATESVTVGDLDGGRYHDQRERPGAAPQAGAPDGELQLDRPAPVHVALLLRHVVLAQQVVAPGQTALTFTVDPTDAQKPLATLRLRLLDGASGAPLPGITVGASTAQGDTARGKSDAEGRVVLERVLPGILSLQARAKDHEGLWVEVRVPTGGDVDLGDVRLHPALELKGRVLDGKGRPVSGHVQWTPLDTMTHPRELIDRRSAMVDGDGEFTLHVGRRRYVVIATAEDDSIGAIEVDGGTAQPCEIHVAPPVLVRIVANGARRAAYMATVRDRDGTPIAARRIEPHWREQTLRVPPGEHTLEVHDSTDRLVLSRTIAAEKGLITVEVGG